ncbi:MAG: hypothetical protein J6Y64_00760 [Ruminococcus sp.]|nr:hypothetical protein [Ruminococcus sp.]
MDDRIIIDYYYKDQIVPDMIYKFMDDNNYDRELLILGVSESAGNQTENKTKNYAYFSSLSDEEVIREYKAYRESVGNPITDKQIIQAVWYAANNRWQTSNQTPLKEIKNGNISDVGFTEQEAEAITSQPGVYFGFDDQLKNGDIGWGSYQEKYYMFFDLSLPERFKDSSAKEVLCEYMRRDLAMANSQFVKDYCPDGYVYTLGGADSAKSVLPVAGDANQDGKVTLADSLTILQFIANEEKYPLSKSGLAAADCYDPGDGITAMDALAVQKRDLGVLSSLPEIPGITDDNAGIKAELTVYLNENNIPAWIASGNWEVPDNKIAVEYYWVNKDVPEQIRAFMESRGLSYDMITYVIQE